MADNTVLIVGNTYPVKDQLKTLGGRWDAGARGWRVPEERATEAQALVAAHPAAAAAAPSARRANPVGWRPCGYPGCHSAYCDECDGRGAGVGRRASREDY